MVQMATCGEFVEQTWPLYGHHMLAVVEEAVKPGSTGGKCESCSSDAFKIIQPSWLLTGQTGQLEEDVFLHVWVDKPYVHLECEGPVPILVQIISQFAWLGAACRASAQAGRFCYSSPRIVNLRQGDGSTAIDLDYSSRYPEHSSDHSCWWDLCPGASIASGFPIRARGDKSQGMELNAEAMIVLGATDYATTHNGHFMLKGFSTMFLPTLRLAKGVLWHFIKEVGGPLSYSNDWVMRPEQVVLDLDVNCLYTMRHFVGWVSEAEILTGIYSLTSRIISN